MKPGKPQGGEPSQEQQVLRFLTSKREQFATIILSGLVQNPAIISHDGEILAEQAVKAAVQGADTLLQELYPVKKEDGNTEK